MTDTEIRIAIAEACGFKWWKFTRKNGSFWCQLVKGSDDWPKHHHFGGEPVNGFSSSDPNEKPDHTAAPDYPKDLNAMHEAEKAGIIDDATERVFQIELCKVCGNTEESRIGENFKVCIHATARQRAEAFLKTLGKWKD